MRSEPSTWGCLHLRVHCLQSCWLLPCIYLKHPVTAAGPKRSMAQGVLSKGKDDVVT